MACFLKYSWKESPAQRPLAFMTSNGTPCRRYLSVDPILIPCPCSGSRPAARAASPTLSRNLDLVSAWRVFATLYTNRWDEFKGWLIQRCWASALVGSVSPSWVAQYTSSPLFPAALVLGRCSTVTWSPLRSWSYDRCSGVMCVLQLKLPRVRVVNSPSLAEA